MTKRKNIVPDVEDEEETIPLETPENTDQLIKWCDYAKEKDSINFNRYITTAVKYFLKKEKREPTDEERLIIINEYKTVPLYSKLINIRYPLYELNTLIGMKTIKKTLTDMVLYYIQNLNNDAEYLHTVITGPPGCGKCLHPNTFVKMFNGDNKKAKYIKTGDLLLGDDHLSREVLSTTKGFGMMYKIKQTIGMSYTVNSQHILTLVLVKPAKIKNDFIRYADKYGLYYVRYSSSINIPDVGDIIDISVLDFLKRPKKWRDYYQGYKIDIHKNIIHSKIKIKKRWLGRYFGFQLNGNGRFLLKDMTVTHNSTVAEQIGRIYAGMGILPSPPKYKKAGRTDFVAKYLGQTADKTKEFLTGCLGGVVLIDEAYSLAPKDTDRDSYSKELLDTLNEFLSEHRRDFVCIISGYKDDLENTFFAMNQGLHRRFPWRFDIPEYSAKDISDIITKKLLDIEWSLEKDAITEELIEKNIDYFKHFGGDVETFLTKCKLAHARRVFKKGVKRLLTTEDILKGLEEHKNHYIKKDGSEPPIGMYT